MKKKVSIQEDLNQVLYFDKNKCPEDLKSNSLDNNILNYSIISLIIIGGISLFLYYKDNKSK